MAVYTHLSRPQIAKFVHLYNLGRLRRFSAIAGGNVNSIYKLTTTRGSFILRILENRSKKDAHFEEKLLTALTKHHLNVAPMLLNRSGERLTWFSARQPVALFPYIVGRELLPGEVGSDHARQIGGFLGQFHQIPTHNIGTKHYAFAPETMRTMLQRCQRHNRRRELTEVLERLAPVIEGATWSSELPTGVVHGDLFVDNVRFLKQRLKAVFDFEMAGFAPLVFDLAVSTCDWAFTGATFFPQRARTLVRAYQKHRPLLFSEKSTFYSMCLFAAARFTLARIHNIELFRPHDARLVLKDYREFFGRFVAFAQNLGLVRNS